MRKGRILATLLVGAMLISSPGTTNQYLAKEKADTEYVLLQEENAVKNNGKLPKSYSSSAYMDWDFEVQKNYVTPVKDQGDVNPTDWAYSIMSAMETSYIINEGVTDVESVDLSEYHLVYYMNNIPNVSQDLFGGDSVIVDLDVTHPFVPHSYSWRTSLMALGNWFGAAEENLFSLEDINKNHPDELGYDALAHLEDYYSISIPWSGEDSDELEETKRLIMEYGSLLARYNPSGDEESGYVYNKYAYKNTYFITIVGWDDTIPASKFGEITGDVPDGDGAWLVKNSFGPDGEFAGYFWVSYYDASMAGQQAYALNAVGADNYDNNYQYDGSTAPTVLYGENGVSFANAFVADSRETLEAVSLHVDDVDTSYEIRIYTNLDEFDLPQDGELVHVQTGEAKYGGYYTVELEEKISLEEGERYAIVVSLTRKVGNAFEVLVDSPTYYRAGYYFNSYAKAGQSYFGDSVETLTDLNAENIENEAGINVRIKAFTNENVHTVKATGQCGDNLGWLLDTEGVLEISGTGSMWDFCATDIGAKERPWQKYEAEIKAVVFKNGVTSVGSSAFEGCTNLEKVVLADTITAIEEFAFHNCEKIKLILLGENVSSIDGTSFAGCSSLFKVGVSPKNKELTSIDGVLYSADKKSLIQYPAAKRDTIYRMDGSTEEIGAYAFYGAQNIEKIVIGKNVGVIADMAFASCSSLKSLCIPCGVTWIGNRILDNTYGLMIIKNDSDLEFSLPITNDLNWMDRESNSIQKLSHGVAFRVVDYVVKETGIEISASSSKCPVNGTLQLNVAFLPENATYQDVSFVSSDESIATVDENGLVRANENGKEGSVTITAISAYGQVCDTFSVDVVEVLVSSITLNYKEAYMCVGESVQLKVEEVLPATASNKAIRWSSSDETVITVDENGMVKAVGKGNAYILARAKDGSGVYVKCEFEVYNPVIEDAWIEAPSDVVGTGEQIQFSVVVEPENAEYEIVEWEAKNKYEGGENCPGEIDQNGLFTADYRRGTVIISVTLADDLGEYTLFYELEVARIEKITKITLDKSKLSLEKGETAQLHATTEPEKLYDIRPVWESKDPSIATVDDEGVVKAVGYGTTTIIVKAPDDDSVYAACEVTVREPFADGLHEYKGNLYYYVDGKIITSYTGVAEYEGDLWYVKNGIVDMTTNGLKNCNGIWYLFRNSKVNRITTLVNYNGKWWYVENGQINFNYDGIASYNGERWYIENGQVDFSKNGLHQRSGKWYYFKNGSIDRKFTGLTQYGGSWWYVEKGELDFDFTDLVQYGGSWWYVQDSTITFKYDGLVDFNGSSWYIEDSKVDFGKNGLYQRGDWYYFKNGAVDYKFTGLTNSAYGWWYIEKGKVTFNYTDLVQYGGSWWYIQNSHLNFKYDGVVDFNGATWYLEDSKVDFSKNGLHQRGNWYYFKGGAVDSGFTGLTNSVYGWWYIEKGKITFAYTDLVYYGGSWWYVQNSNITFKYDGLVDFNGATWFIEDSKVDFNKNGLHQRGGNWYLFQSGAVNKIDTIEAFGENLWYVDDGKVDFGFTGTYEFKGKTYHVVNGQATLVN